MHHYILLYYFCRENRDKMGKERLFTKSYCCLLSANFLLYFGFWLLTPILPIYLTEAFNSGTSVAGIIISCYTVSGMFIRPFSGYLLDTFARKPLYMTAYFIFVAMFAGYLVAGYLMIFAMIRIVHGLAYGMVTVGGNTLVIDIMPSARRGEGLGYYGLSNNMAMATGPMIGLFMHNNGINFKTIFGAGLCFCIIGFLMATMVNTPYKAPVKRPPISLDRFLLLKGIPGGIALLLLSIPYGMTTNYIAMYARECGITTETGFFFTLTAIGMAVSRIMAGKVVDKGYVTEIISAGFYGVVLCFIGIGSLAWVCSENILLGTTLFYVIPLILGISFGIMFPAYNTLFVNLASNNQRGTATSTYLTSWDLGLGLGIVLGGHWAETSGFSTAYFIGAGLAFVSAIFFNLYAAPHFQKNRVR